MEAPLSSVCIEPVLYIENHTEKQEAVVRWSQKRDGRCEVSGCGFTDRSGFESIPCLILKQTIQRLPLDQGTSGLRTGTERSGRRTEGGSC